MTAASDLVVVVVRPIAEHLVTLSHRLPLLRRVAGGARIGVVVVGDGPYRASDVVSLDVDVLGELPDDPRAAGALVEGGRSQAGFARSRLARSAAGLSTDLARTLLRPSPVGEGR